MSTAAAENADSAAWDRLTAELDRWAEAGAVATFWWRDDDAAETHPALTRLLALAGDRPLALAAIPARLDVALAEHLALGRAGVSVLPHGFRHDNHAPAGEKKAEFGPHRAAEVMLAEIGAGWARLKALTEARAAPLFVPPWNRIDPALAARLGEAGLDGLSVHGARTPAQRGARLNAHIDIVDWKGGRGFVGVDRAIDLAARHLAARRAGDGAIDPAEPTGLLTHHRDHDAGCWAFLERFLDHLDRHPAARLVGAAEGLGA